MVEAGNGRIVTQLRRRIRGSPPNGRPTPNAKGRGVIGQMNAQQCRSLCLTTAIKVDRDLRRPRPYTRPWLVRPTN